MSTPNTDPAAQLQAAVDAEEEEVRKAYFTQRELGKSIQDAERRAQAMERLESALAQENDEPSAATGMRHRIRIRRGGRA